MKNEWFKNLPVVFLAMAIALSPSFSVGKLAGGTDIEIRVEDFLIVILGLVWIANFLISGGKKIKKPPLFAPILAWLGIGFFSVLINWIFGNIKFSWGFFYFLKEVEFFFLYFYIFCHIKSFKVAKFVIKVWIGLGLINIGWIVYESITGLRLTYYYGPTSFIEPDGSSPSGGFFLMIFIFLFSVLLFYYFNFNISKFKKGFLAIAALSPAIGVFTSGSKGSFFGLVFALFFVPLLYFFKKRSPKSFLMSILIIIFIPIVFVFFSSIFPAINRAIDIGGVWREFSAEEGSRLNVWEGRLSKLRAEERPLILLFGLGKSAGEESHSHYVKNFVETGIIGSLIFLFLIFFIIKKAFQGFSSGGDPLSVGLSCGLLAATLAMLLLSVGNDAFIVVKINEVYWFFAALTMAVLNLSKKGPVLTE